MGPTRVRRVREEGTIRIALGSINLLVIVENAIGTDPADIDRALARARWSRQGRARPEQAQRIAERVRALVEPFRRNENATQRRDGAVELIAYIQYFPGFRVPDDEAGAEWSRGIWVAERVPDEVLAEVDMIVARDAEVHRPHADDPARRLLALRQMLDEHAGELAVAVRCKT